LEYNLLTTINACAFDDALGVEEIWLTGNAIHCDCAVAWTSPAPTNQTTPVCSFLKSMVFNINKVDLRRDRLVVGWVNRYARKKYVIQTDCCCFVCVDFILSSFRSISISVQLYFSCNIICSNVMSMKQLMID